MQQIHIMLTVNLIIQQHCKGNHCLIETKKAEQLPYKKGFVLLFTIYKGC